MGRPPQSSSPVSSSSVPRASSNRTSTPRSSLKGTGWPRRRPSRSSKSISTPLKTDDFATLQKIAVTSMASKSVSYNRDALGEIAVKAVTAVAEKNEASTYVDLDNIQIVKKQGGAMTDTQLIEGVIVDKEKVHSGMPTRVVEPKIALLDAALEIKKTEIDAKIEINDPSQLNAFLQEEESMLRRMVDQVKKSGATALFCQKGIDDLAQHYLAKEGIYAVRRVKKSDMEKLAKATGANVVSKVSELAPEDIGHAALVEERKIGEDSLTLRHGREEGQGGLHLDPRRHRARAR